MRVVLAGYNVDAEVLRRAETGAVSREQLTPEVMSAAYARISRDPRPVDVLRREALEEVARARASNRKIIFGMGHHSVAEHAVFNFDILGLSRLAIEALESFRLCSFTEKSQRYIAVDHDYVMPEELAQTPVAVDLELLVAEQAATYKELYEGVMARALEKNPEIAGDKNALKLLEGTAKEDARYATLLATSGQLGLTANARNLEHIVRRLAASPLAELRALGRILFDTGASVAPSLLLFTEPSRFDLETPVAVRALASELMTAAEGNLVSSASPPSVTVVDAPSDCDSRIAAALLASATGRPLESCRAVTASAPREKLEALFCEAMRRMEFFDAPLRELEHVSLTFDLIVSAACFAQLKRHRMATLSPCRYDPALGLTVPPSIADAGLDARLRRFAVRAEEVSARIDQISEDASAYALTNAHRRRVIATMNLRELYHFSRLREDAHAQWDIRVLAGEMRLAVEKIAPLGALLLCGKDSYVERYGGVFGTSPRIDPAALA